MMRACHVLGAEKVNVLLVDDQSANLLALETVLDELGQTLVRASSGEEALRHLLSRDFAVILLDVQMHGMDGFETARLIRSRPRSRFTPIIFLTAYDNHRLAEGYALGAVDFLTKPFEPNILRSKVRVFVELFQKSEQIRQQAEQLQLLERKAFESELAEAKHRWETERWRQEAAREKEMAAALAQKTLELQEEMAQRKQAEEDRQKMQAQMQHAQKLESLGVLAGGIAHDFNNLLTGILGNASLALIELPAESPVVPLIRQIDLAAARAAELTGQLLAYSGKGRFRLGPLQLSGLIEEMAALLRTVISKKAALQFDFASDLPAIIADSAQVRQVVMNLITNASDAMGEEGGVISIRTMVVHATSESLRSLYLKDKLPEGDYVSLEVSDTGSGIDEAIIGKIFEPFFTTKFTGRGLGLSAVLGIVQGHRGSIQVRSQPGSGTTFQLLLPVAKGTKTVAAPVPSAPARRLLRGTVLVVDDEETIRRVVQKMLESFGLNVVLAADGREGLDIMEQRGEEIGAVLLDLLMPNMGGEEVFGQLHLHRPDLPIILMSGYSAEEATAHFQGRGLAGFIQKPFRIGEIRGTIGNVFEVRPQPVPVGTVAKAGQPLMNLTDQTR